MMRGEPPPTSTFLSLPSAPNPMKRLSGDQNGENTPSVPGITLKSVSPSGAARVDYGHPGRRPGQ